MKQVLPDVEMVRARIITTNTILTMMHGALCEISKLSITKSDCRKMKQIAADTILEVQRVAENTEVQDA